MCRGDALGSDALPPPAPVIYLFRCWVSAWELDSGSALFEYSGRTNTLYAADVTRENILRLIDDMYGYGDREYYTQWGIEEIDEL